MLRSSKELRGYTMSAADGDVGEVHEFYFDDLAWIVRYLVVDTGGWLEGERVLISPLSLGIPNWEDHRFPIRLTREQIENAPQADTARPVSRQYEEELHDFYDWSPYWLIKTPPYAGNAGSVEAAHILAGRQETLRGEEEPHPHLRSTREVINYRVQAIDGQIGHVDDFIFDDDGWIVRYVVVETKDILPGKRVLVAPSWFKDVKWLEENVYVDLHKETIKNSPEYDPSAPVNREYEIRLYDYYGRPRYF